MNQYKTPQSLHPQLEQIFSVAGQPNQFPLFAASQPQSAHQVSKSFFDYLNQSKTTPNARNTSSFDSLAEPTKKLKSSPQSLTKTSPIPLSAQTFKQSALPTDLGDLTMKDTFPVLSPSESKQANPVSPFGEDLTMPGLNSLSQGIFQKLSYQAYERMLQQQLQQRKAQYYLQQQIMMHLTRQQQQMPYGDMNARQFAAPQIDPKVLQLYQQAMSNGSDVPKVKTESPNVVNELVNSGFKTTEKTSVAPNVPEAKIKDKSQPVKSSKVPEKTEVKHKEPTKKKGPKRVDWSQYKRVVGDNIYRKTKEEPRTKNKWQCKDGEQSESTMEPENLESQATPKESPTVEKRAEEIKDKKPQKPVDIPQHMQDESMIDYETLISVTLTNDPMYAGHDNPKANFITVTKNSNPLCIQPRDTRVGDRYQVPVPEFTGKVPSKKRTPKTIWKPEIVKETELKAYFDELCKIFSCEKINQEQALRLLKSKKYRKERVAVNIGKSRKYYAKVLVAPGENNNEVINEEVKP